jgi:hypothetical protein
LSLAACVDGGRCCDYRLRENAVLSGRWLVYAKS